jgi:hypothetical protein
MILLQASASIASRPGAATTVDERKKTSVASVFTRCFETKAWEKYGIFW